jgi:hypothetical protein
MYKSIEKLTIEEFVSRMQEIPAHKRRPRKRNWLRLIEANKLTCPTTGLKVAYCSLDEQGKYKKTYHYNFYSECGQMFTIDHIHPVSKGGPKEALGNIQPMIDIHNWEKSDKLDYKYESK